MGLIIALMFVGILLILVELFLIPGVGVAGFLGLASFGGSCYYAFAHFGTSMGTIVTVVCVSMTLGLLYYTLRAKTWKKLALDTVIDSKPKPWESISVGDPGITVTRLAPMGMARFGSVTCEVKSMENIIDPGVNIEVVSVEDKIIYVKPVEGKSDNN